MHSWVMGSVPDLDLAAPWYIRRFPGGGGMWVRPGGPYKPSDACGGHSVCTNTIPAMSNRPPLPAKIRSQRGLWQSKRHHHTPKGKR